MLKLLLLFVFLLGGTALAGPVLEGDIEERIIGGTPAAVGQYPHQISLKSKLYFHICGGSLIAHSWVLSAAHCTFGKAPGSLEVTVGSNYINSGGFTTDVSSLVYYEGYNPESTANDIVLVRLARSITFNPVVQPARLSDSPMPTDASCWLSGWGQTKYPSQNLPDALQHFRVTLITIEECQKMLLGSLINQSNICSHDVRGKGVCRGDLGSPLTCNGVQHGIASWNIPCANGVPDVYTNVSFYRSWIKARTGI